MTGGTGMVGSHLVPKLVAAGHEVFALTRSKASYVGLEAMGAMPFHADLESASALTLPAIDAVVHAAALFRFSGPRAPFFRTNVGGTRALLTASAAAGAVTFIHISAAGIIMDERGTPVRNADERAPTFPSHFSAYLASKAQAESLVLAAHRPGFRTIALRPSALWGPGDPFSRALPHAIGSGQFVFVDRGDYAFSTCHVDNILEAVACGLDRGRGGRPYFINDPETPTFREFIAGLAGVQGLSIGQLRSMPYWLVSAAGRMFDAFWAVSRKKGDPPLSRAMVRMIGRPFSVDDAAARGELGYVGRVSRSEGLKGYGAHS